MAAPAQKVLDWLRNVLGNVRYHEFRIFAIPLTYGRAIKILGESKAKFFIYSRKFLTSLFAPKYSVRQAKPSPPFEWS